MSLLIGHSELRHKHRLTPGYSWINLIVREAIKNPACDYRDREKRGNMKTKDFVSIILTMLLIPLMANLSRGSEKVVFPEIPRISAEEMKIMMDTGADFIRVDVRDGGSYAAGHF